MTNLKNVCENAREIASEIASDIANEIISITGTNGKSTICKLLEEVFKNAGFNVELVGNIGRPFLSLKKFNKKTLFIIELSSYQLEYTKYFRSNHSAILNIFPDHLDRHDNFKKYINAKLKIFKFQFRKFQFERKL